MREEYNSVLSTPIEADNIGRFGRCRYISAKPKYRPDISADISVYLYKVEPREKATRLHANTARIGFFELQFT